MKYIIRTFMNEMALYEVVDDTCYIQYSTGLFFGNHTLDSLKESFDFYPKTNVEYISKEKYEQLLLERL